MITSLRNAAIALAIGMAGLAAMPMAAKADSVTITMGGSGVQLAQSGYRYDRYRERPRHRACSPNRAVEKAWKLGVNRPRVANVGRNTITVRGFQRGYPVMVRFARAPNCPVIR